MLYCIVPVHREKTQNFLIYVILFIQNDRKIICSFTKNVSQGLLLGSLGVLHAIVVCAWPWMPRLHGLGCPGCTASSGAAQVLAPQGRTASREA